MVSRSEFCEGLISSRTCAASLRPAIEEVFDEWDEDGSGEIDFRELHKKLRTVIQPPTPSEYNPAQMVLTHAPRPAPILVEWPAGHPRAAQSKPGDGQREGIRGAQPEASTQEHEPEEQAAAAVPPPPHQLKEQQQQQQQQLSLIHI